MLRGMNAVATKKNEPARKALELVNMTCLRFSSTIFFDQTSSKAELPMPLAAQSTRHQTRPIPCGNRPTTHPHGRTPGDAAQHGLAFARREEAREEAERHVGYEHGDGHDHAHHMDGKVAERPVRKQRGAPEQAEDPPEVEREAQHAQHGDAQRERPRTPALGMFFLEVCRIGGHVASARLLACTVSLPLFDLTYANEASVAYRAFAAFERFLRRIRRFPERFSPEITNSPGSAKRQRGQGAAVRRGASLLAVAEQQRTLLGRQGVPRLIAQDCSCR